MKTIFGLIFAVLVISGCGNNQTITRIVDSPTIITGNFPCDLSGGCEISFGPEEYQFCAAMIEIEGVWQTVGGKVDFEKGIFKPTFCSECAEYRLSLW